MVRSVRLRSLAKVNLDLRVLHKRPDGYHELRTVFQTISLADTLEIRFEAARRTELSLDDPQAIPDNLVLRAAQAVLEALRIQARVGFRLRKQIPMGSGLGGGSSNAAAVLLALPVLAGKRLPFDLLWELGGRLGSDVPFFLSGGTALGIGRGTEFYGLPDVAPEPLLVVCPAVHSSTTAAYGALRRGLTVTGSSSILKGFRTFVEALGELRSVSRAGALSHNDFQAVVAAQHPALRRLPDRLRNLGAVHAAMTGSGSAFFAVFDSRPARDRALEQWRRGRGNPPAVAAEVVSQRRYRALWRRQLRDHIVGDTVWPPQSQHG
jgi:4-diphosphocytidyl-2-C-methyl-D-erythritol kinase